MGSLHDDHDQWAGQPNQLITKLEDSLDYSVFSLNGLNHPLSSEADSDSLPIQYSMGIVGGLIQAPLNGAGRRTVGCISALVAHTY